jgi:Xaa-Pro aminopeptidase
MSVSLSIDDGLPTIAAQEFERRAEAVRGELRERGLDVGVAYGTPHVPGDVQYLTGYDPNLENAVVVVAPDRVVALGGAEGEAMFADGGRLGEWRNLGAFEIPYQDYGDTRFWSLREVLEESLGEVPARIGLLSQKNVLSGEIVELVSAPGVELVDASEILLDARYRKSPLELAMFRVASSIATEAMRAMVAAVAPGVRELEVAAEGDRVAKQRGAYGFGFDTIVCAGERIDTIIGRATNRVIADGELVMLGVSPRYEGYTSALGRTVVAGAATAAQVEFLEHGIRAYELATEQLRQGGPASAVDLAAREHLGSVGLAQYHAYGVGHGIGLSECLEWKTATRLSTYDFPAGVAMMIDVGLFGHPTFFGARHEDPFAIDHDGVTERLTDLPMNVLS